MRDEANIIFANIMLAYGYTQTNLSNLTEISKTGNHFYNFKGVNFLCKMNPKNTKFEAIFLEIFSQFHY
jgi:hypothetical protein